VRERVENATPMRGDGSSVRTGRRTAHLPAPDCASIGERAATSSRSSCPDCAGEALHIARDGGGALFIICASCGARGPARDSAYDAMADRLRLLTGRRIPTMVQQAALVSALLLALIAVTGVVVMILG